MKMLSCRLYIMYSAAAPLLLSEKNCEAFFSISRGRSPSHHAFIQRRIVVDFASGGGGGFGASQKKRSKRSSNKKKKNKKALVDLVPDEEKKKTKQEDETQQQQLPPRQEPLLDRFGLPLVPTEEELFPPMPPGTELIAVASPSKKGSAIQRKKDIEEALRNHLKVNLDNFDENAVQKLKEEGSTSSTAVEPMRLQLMHVSPPVLAIENFFTKEECEEYKNKVLSPEENDSIDKKDDDQFLQINSATFSPLATSKRTSTTWFCHYAQVPALLAKAKYLLKDIPLEHMEEPQIVRYRTGEEFSWHYDEVPAQDLENGGQRIGTLLVYLNTLEEGGGTVFRDLKDANGGTLTMKPKQGTALLFFPAFADGRPDDRTLHKGEVAIDEKIISQIWIHERPYQPVVPKGNSHDAAKDLIRKQEEELNYN